MSHAELGQIFRGIYYSPKDRRYFFDTVLGNGKTAEQCGQQLTKLIEDDLIIQQRCYDENGMLYLLLQTNENCVLYRRWEEQYCKNHR